jgi:hypothetical protein
VTISPSIVKGEGSELTVARMDKSSKSRKQAKVTLPTAAYNLKPEMYSVFSSTSRVDGWLLFSPMACVLGASFSEIECRARMSFCSDFVVVMMSSF